MSDAADSASLRCRFQFVWYGWMAWRRPYFERFTNGLRYVYEWRIAIGPIDVRRWQRRSFDAVRDRGTR